MLALEEWENEFVYAVVGVLVDGYTWPPLHVLDCEVHPPPHLPPGAFWGLASPTPAPLIPFHFPIMPMTIPHFTFMSLTFCLLLLPVSNMGGSTCSDAGLSHGMLFVLFFVLVGATGPTQAQPTLCVFIRCELTLLPFQFPKIRLFTSIFLIPLLIYLAHRFPISKPCYSKVKLSSVLTSLSIIVLISIA